jgi:rare lipoprotein A
VEIKKLLLSLLCLFVTGCSTSEERYYKKLSKEDASHITYMGHYKVGKEYNIKGEKYKPEKKIVYKEVGMASWYGSKGGFHGKKTANGDKYNKNVLSAAHNTLPMPSLVKVTNISNNKSLIVMINDRGPFSKKRIIDVSEKAAHILGFKNQGVTKVKVEYLHKETQDFLKKIALEDKHGAKSKKKSKKENCSINCHVKLMNINHKIPISR